MTAERENRLKTDVLVLGGGLSGCFAAMKAREAGAKVTVVEKTNVMHGGSNATGIDHFTNCYVPEIHGAIGLKVEDFIKDHTLLGNGIVDQDLLELHWTNSYDRLLDLEKIGIRVRFHKIFPWNFGIKPGDYPDEPKFRMVPWFGFKYPPTVHIEGRHIKKQLYYALTKLGVRLLDGVSAQSILSPDGHAAGAIGFDVETGDTYIIEAKAVVVATGFLSGLYPTRNDFANRLVPSDQVAEGQMMALRGGAELAVMEEYPRSGSLVRLGATPHLKNWTRSLPATPSGYPAGRVVNGAGEEMPSDLRSFDRSYKPDLEQRQVEWVRRSIREGKTPFYWDATAATHEERAYAEWSCENEGGGFGFFKHFKEHLGADFATHQIELHMPIIGEKEKSLGFQLTSPSGIIINTRTETRVAGLYAAGEAAYGVYFPAATWAFVTGARAGRNAAEYARGRAATALDEAQVDEQREQMLRPLRAKPQNGVKWQELRSRVQNIAKSFLLRPTADGLERGLESLNALKPLEVQVDDAHELMRCAETRTLLTVVELFLRAALFPIGKSQWRVVRLKNGHLDFSTRPLIHKYPVNGALFGTSQVASA